MRIETAEGKKALCTLVGGREGRGESGRRPIDCSYVLAPSSTDPQETRAEGKRAVLFCLL